MSFFAAGTTPAPSATSAPAMPTGSTAFQTSFNFGAPTGSTVATQPQTLGIGGFPMFGVSTAAQSMPPLGAPSTTATQFGNQPSLFPTSIAPLGVPGASNVVPVAPGLTGFRPDKPVSMPVTNLGVVSVTTPKETNIPQEVEAEVNALTKQIKTNRDLAEAIASADVRSLNSIDEKLASVYVDYTKTFADVQATTQSVKALKAECRQDLLDGEMAQRLRDSLMANFEYAAPLDYLLRLAETYEKVMAAYAEQLQQLERLVFGQSKEITSDDISRHLVRIDAAFRHVFSQYYDLHKDVQTLKDKFKDYRRVTYGDAAKFFPPAASAKSRLARIEGPNPFSAPSNSTVLAVANALSRAQAGAGLAANLSFQAPLATGFAMPNQQAAQPFGSAPLFRPFTATAPATSTTAPGGFGTSTISFSMPSQTTAAATSTPAPWRFSSPFNTSSSGTLFGGSATNFNANKPLGFAAPLQQTPSSTTASLQLLNPPSGSKRSK